MAAPASEQLTAARAAVDRASQLLLAPTPEQMDRCASLLEDAISDLTTAGGHCDPSAPACKPPNTETLVQARLLESSVGRAKHLLDSAGAFYSNWIRCLAALCAGYTGSGQPASIERSGRLSVRG